MTQRAPAAVGQRLEDVDTPALVLDLDGFEKNLNTLKSSAGNKVRIRPHAKTHKCPDVARRQIALGAVGMCCQKVSEAEAMVDGGVTDVLVSNEIVGAPKLARLAELTRRAKIGVCVDNAENVRQLKGDLDVYIEIDVGMRRCGVAPGAPAVALAKEIVKSGLRFAGLQAYHGRAQHIRSMEERHAVIETAAQHVQHTKRLLKEAGIDCPIVTGAGSGHFHAGSRGRRLGRDPVRLLRVHGRGLREERMGRAAAALRARAVRAEHGDEPAFRGGGDRRCRAEGLERGFRHAGRMAERAALHACVGRARLGGGEESARAGREAAIGAGSLRPDHQPVRLVRLRSTGTGRGAMADNGSGSCVLSTRNSNASQPGLAKVK
jgi:hypothetical protein